MADMQNWVIIYDTITDKEVPREIKGHRAIDSLQVEFGLHMVRLMDNEVDKGEVRLIRGNLIGGCVKPASGRWLTYSYRRDNGTPYLRLGGRKPLQKQYRSITTTKIQEIINSKIDQLTQRQSEVKQSKRSKDDKARSITDMKDERKALAAAGKILSDYLNGGNG